MIVTQKPDAPVKVTLSLPADVVRRIDERAEAERRTRSNAAAVLLERALAEPTATPTR